MGFRRENIGLFKILTGLKKPFFFTEQGMTNEKIKESLLKLYDCKEDFTVVQSGKQSKRVNGLYRPATHEIILHNKNFKSDNELMYTAIHEMTHHVLSTEKGVKTAKAHSGAFWATFYDFIDRAVELGLYSRKRSEETQELIKEAKEIQRELIALQKKLGSVLNKLYSVCAENGDRIEDVIESDLQISMNKAKELEKMAANNTDFSDEMTKTIQSAKDVMLAKQAAEDGKTVEQVKAIAKQKAKPADDDLESPESLLKEKAYLEQKIDQLQDRLVQVEETLASMRGEL